MRNTIAIFLLTLFASTTEAGQLLKLPLLISHFIEHNREEGQSIYAFLHEHYVHHHGPNKDEDEDNRLPFKSTIVQQASFTCLLPVAQTVNKPTAMVGNKKIILPYPDISSQFLKDIFHPPRMI